MTGLFYKILYNGLLACGGFVSLIIAIIVWRKMWLGGKTFAELGSEGNVIVFMIGLVVISFLIAWRIKKAKDRLDL